MRCAQTPCLKKQTQQLELTTRRPHYSKRTYLPTRTTATMQHGIRVAQFLTMGYTTFGSRGFKENAKSFDPRALDVNLSGRNVIVTGATSGLGRATARELAARKATVHLVVRDAGRGEKVREELISSLSLPSEQVHVHRCDVSSLKDIQDLAAQFTEPVHVLVNNAGVLKSEYSPSVDGFESAFATNTLGTFALTECLIPMLKAASPPARVINVSSGGMLTENLYIDDFEGKAVTKANGTMDGPAQYSRCKRRQVALAEYWTRKYKETGIYFMSCHPGWSDTAGLATSMSAFYNLTKSQLRTEDQGADTMVYLAAVEDLSHIKSGEFYFDRQPSVKHLKLSGTQYKDADVDRLVDKLRDMVKEKGLDLPQ